MKTTVPELAAERVSVQQIDVGELRAGPMDVGRLVVEQLHLDVQTGTARMNNLRVTMTLQLSIEWKVQVSIPLLGSFGWDGSIDLGTHSLALGLGDVTVPGLQHLTLDLSQLALDGLHASLEPLRDLRLGPLSGERLRVADLVTPAAGFAVHGLGLGRVAIEGVTVPDTVAGALTVDRVQGQIFPLGQVTLPGLTLPSAGAADISSGPVDVSASSDPLRIEADAGVLELALRVLPSARTQVDELRLAGVRVGGSLGPVELHDVVLPYEILGLRLHQLGIETVELPKIEVS